jgi:arsenate reductase (thioredoxin)
VKGYVLFVCQENSARSQMAEAFFNHYNKNPGYVGISAGLKPADRIKPLAVEVMKEKGIDISHQKPKNLTFELIEGAGKIITMGCVKSCPAAPPEKTIDWKLKDPAGRPIGEFRRVRDEVERKVKEFISGLEGG